MTQNNQRRQFLRLLGIGGLGVVVAADGQESHGDVPKREFRGVSKSGDVGEALHNAVAAAERSVRHPDAMVEWRIKSVSGRSGGIAGMSELTVTIEATVT